MFLSLTWNEILAPNYTSVYRNCKLIGRHILAEILAKNWKECSWIPHSQNGLFQFRTWFKVMSSFVEGYVSFKNITLQESVEQHPNYISKTTDTIFVMKHVPC